MTSIYIIAGEVSGDTHGAGLIKELLVLDPEVKITGLGGPRMKEIAGHGIEDWVETAGVVGLWEVLKMYSYFKQKFTATVTSILTQQPAAVILVDYPGFNLRVAKDLRTKGYTGKIIYYISPQVWAWKKGRVKTMAKVLDLMICIFPFEKDFYEKSGLPTEFSGHPMVDRVVALRRNWERERALVGWFPGSRLNEVKRLFPIMLQAALAIRMMHPQVRFAVSAANETLAGHLRQMADDAGMPEAKTWIETGTVYDLMQRAQVGAVASGTATLEAACFGLPYALVYQVNLLTYIAAKTVVRIKNIGIVNVLAKRDIVKELVQGRLNSDTLAAEMVDLLTNDVRRRDLQEDLAEVVATLGHGGAYRRAAQAVIGALTA
ncbi:lipid-A-disaccharide synthase [Prosthecobacter fusiformis]|uniref:Lipid-A-disaccharide synthase n=1 Tax=Prosthecobacter fusiformis TaxID=48464 RepID=A0A4R7RPY9_9BACT|nr:lipid-A-disaccharide synthase [Prosthecobacter fusiformis]TDU67149.1 lipid-A-disaccharide synthase [Prosthecobacter fusiformis]